MNIINKICGGIKKHSYKTLIFITKISNKYKQYE